PASGRWPQEDGRQRSDPPDRSRGAGGADRLGRSDVATALDLEKRPAVGGESAAHGSSGQPATGGRALGGGGLQSASQSQDAGGAVSSGPRRAVPLYQPARPAVPRGHATRHLRRHEEERTGRRLQKRRTPVANDRAAHAGAGA